MISSPNHVNSYPDFTISAFFANLLTQNILNLFCKVREEDQHLLGFSWQRHHHNLEFFIHASLPFGLTSTCYLLDQIADSLQLVMKRMGAPPTTTHYLDDFISIFGS